MQLNYSFILKLFIALVALNITNITNAQNKKSKNKIQFTGSMGVYGDFYKMKSDTIGAVSARRPPQLYRVTVNTSLSYRKFSLPMTASWSSVQRGITFSGIPPIAGNPLLNFKNQLLNPQNRIGISPKIGWFQVLLGSQIPAYSELSVGDLSVFGAGISLDPGKFRFATFIGYSQMAVTRDSAAGIIGSYKRNIASAKIGVGKEDSSHIYLIASKMWDDTNSVAVRPVGLMPQSGVVVSLDYKKLLGKLFYIKGEIAGSGFTRNEFSGTVPSFSPEIPAAVFVPRYSSRFDYASLATLGMNGKIFSFSINGKYYGDGFVAVGFPFMQVDRLDGTIDPKLNLLKNKLQISGSLGRRINNLSAIRGVTSTQAIGSANINWQMTKSFSVNGNYSNFGMRDNATVDTFRVEMITNSWGVSPNYTLSTEASSHNIGLTYSQNTFTDLNIISGATNNNDAVNILGSYSLSMFTNPLTLSTMVSYFKNNTSLGVLQTNSATATAGYAFLKNKLNTSLGLTIADNKFNGAAGGFQVMQLLGLKYKLNKKVSLSANGSLNLYTFGVAKPGIKYRESLLRTSLIYKFK